MRILWIRICITASFAQKLHTGISIWIKLKGTVQGSVADPDPIRIRIHRIHMFLGLPDPDPDPLVRGMDSK
jgi:hypothetical protein